MRPPRSSMDDANSQPDGNDPISEASPATDGVYMTGATGRRLQERVTAGLVFGLIGMLTGCLSLYIAWRTTSQEAAVVLHAYPTASADDLTHVGFGVRAQLVNESLRPVIVESASLWVDGREVTDATGYLADAQLLDQSAFAPATITDARLDFPISMNAREGRSVAILMDVWRPIVAAAGTNEALSARRELNHFLTSVGSLGAGDRPPDRARPRACTGWIPAVRHTRPHRAWDLPGSDPGCECAPASGPAPELAGRAPGHATQVERPFVTTEVCRRRTGRPSSARRLECPLTVSSGSRAASPRSTGTAISARSRRRRICGDLPARRQGHRTSLFPLALERESLCPHGAIGPVWCPAVRAS